MILVGNLRSLTAAVTKDAWGLRTPQKLHHGSAVFQCFFSFKCNYCWWKKSCTSWYGKYPITCRVLTISGGAGFLPSTVVCVVFFWLECLCFGQAWIFNMDATNMDDPGYVMMSSEVGSMVNLSVFMTRRWPPKKYRKKRGDVFVAKEMGTPQLCCPQKMLEKLF